MAIVEPLDSGRAVPDAAASVAIRGVLRGRPVSARWQDRAVTGDPELIRATQLVIARHHSARCGDRTVTASLETQAGAAIALIEALDRVDGIEISMPGTSGL